MLQFFQEELVPEAFPDFEDVKQIFEDASPDIDPEQVLGMKDFALHDAMMAIEVMDPRMDSGMDIPEYTIASKSFNPMRPLLPEEVCWILDRLTAAEMSWHGGKALSQTVYTCLYVHYLPSIRSDGVRRYWPRSGAPPQELVSLVLNAGIHGVLKTCDMVWRQLTRGNLHEMEDFNGEKSGVSLCETIQIPDVLRLLELGKQWLLSKEAARVHWRMQLIARLDFRHALLTAINYTLPHDRAKVKAALRQARAHLKDIRTWQSPSPPADGSPLAYTFDPAIIRRLTSVMPIRLVKLPTQEETWRDVEAMISGIEEACLLNESTSIPAVKVFLRLKARLLPSPGRSGYLRSYSYAALLFANPDVLARPIGDQLFEFLADVTPNIPLSSWVDVSLLQPPLSEESLADFSERIQRYTAEYLGTFFSNRPRQRRNLCNLIPDWTSLCAEAQMVLRSGLISEADQTALLTKVSLVLESLRLEMALDIVLSGLELELYGIDELSFVYWYAETIIHRYLEISVRLASSRSSSTYLEWLHRYLDILALLCRATLLLFITPRRETYSREREQINLERRFKWAVKSALEEDVCSLQLEDWWNIHEQLSTTPGALRIEEAISFYSRAKGALEELHSHTAAHTDRWSSLSRNLTDTHILELSGVCKSNSESLHGLDEIDIWQFKLTDRHRWFPVIP